jgi:protein-tyrosine-phosphatase
MNILFVCRGNVGRSQMAEALLRERLPLLNIQSVGTRVFDKEGNSKEGEKLHEREGAHVVIQVLRELGINAENAKRNQITETAVKDADIVIVMAEKETLPEYLENNPKVRFWDVGDPKERSLEETREIRDRISSYVEDFVAELM